MRERSLEDARKTLEMLDKKRLDERASRLSELGTIETSVIERPQPGRMNSFMEEAGTAYVEGCFRSCIFCCANAVEQAFKHELIFSSDDFEKKYWETVIDKEFTFGKIIKAVEKVNRLRSYIEDASWLNKVRNTIAVHPLYIAPSRNGTKDEKIWKNKTMIRDIKEAMKLLSKDEKEEIMQLKIIDADENKPFSLKDILEDPTVPDIALVFLWYDASDLILKKLALHAHTKMANIIEGLWPVT